MEAIWAAIGSNKSLPQITKQGGGDFEDYGQGGLTDDPIKGVMKPHYTLCVTNTLKM